MRRLNEDELASSPTLPVFAAHPQSPERARAVAAVESLRPFMHEQLALTPVQIDELTLELERALLLHARSRS